MVTEPSQIPAQHLDADTSAQLAAKVRAWGRELGFQQLGITGVDLSRFRSDLERWLELGLHGEMQWMQNHLEKRLDPSALEPGTVRVISARLDYLPPNARIREVLGNRSKAYISRYALGRDYHKLIRRRLAKLAHRIESEAGGGQFRALTDSAPVLEKPLAAEAGLGWQGKHTLLINREAGSWFFLGEIYTDLPLTIDEPQQTQHCGSCTACLDVCPTGAITAPWQLDARRCISYLTIEHKGSIPEPLRPLIGNRVFGCDDCQLVCPWNRYAKVTGETDFHARHGLDQADLVTLFQWTEQEWMRATEGSAIRRLGYARWLRNLAVGLGNAPANPDIISALEQRSGFEDLIVGEHIQWALGRQRAAIKGG